MFKDWNNPEGDFSGQKPPERMYTEAEILSFADWYYKFQSWPENSERPTLLQALKKYFKVANFETF